MRILSVVSSTNPEAGGVIEAINQRCISMKALGHDVEIASLDDPAASWLKNTSTQIHACGPGKSKYQYSSRFGAWLKQNAPSYDAVIVDGIWQYSSLATRNVMTTLGMPYFVFTHGMLDPWFRKAYPLKHLKKLCYWPWAEYRVLRDAKHVIFTCEEERRLARKSFGMYKCNEIISPLGISAPGGNPDQQIKSLIDLHPELTGKLTLLYLGRVHPKKGCDLLINAFAKIAKRDKTVHLIIAGPDSVGLRAELETRARHLRISNRITWTGMLTGDLKWGAIHLADALVLPSHQENFGIVVVEALACGRPVLISNKVNIWREIVQDGAGLAADDTQKGTNSLLLRWAKAPDSDKAEMSVQAKQTFLARFEADAAANHLLSILNSGH